MAGSNFDRIGDVPALFLSSSSLSIACVGGMTQTSSSDEASSLATAFATEISAFLTGESEKSKSQSLSIFSGLDFVSANGRVLVFGTSNVFGFHSTIALFW
jgi:hypothetical protein